MSDPLAAGVEFLCCYLAALVVLGGLRRGLRARRPRLPPSRPFLEVYGVTAKQALAACQSAGMKDWDVRSALQVLARKLDAGDLNFGADEVRPHRILMDHPR